MFSEFDKDYPEYMEKIPFRKRFLDDILGFANLSVAEFDHFVEVLNPWSGSTGWGMKFKVSGVGHQVPYLDTEIYLKAAEWHTRLYSKDTNLHAYLRPESFHPSHIVKNIPMMVAFRIRRICSELEEYDKAGQLYTDTFFARRGYKRVEVLKAFQIARTRNRRTLLIQKPERRLRDGDIPFPFLFAGGPDLKAIVRRLFPILSNEPGKKPHPSG